MEKALSAKDSVPKAKLLAEKKGPHSQLDEFEQKESEAFMTASYNIG